MCQDESMEIHPIRCQQNRFHVLNANDPGENRMQFGAVQKLLHQRLDSMLMERTQRDVEGGKNLNKAKRQSNEVHLEPKCFGL